MYVFFRDRENDKSYFHHETFPDKRNRTVVRITWNSDAHIANRQQNLKRSNIFQEKTIVRAKM